MSFCRRKKAVLCAATGIAALLCLAWAPSATAQQYAGSEYCLPCHQAEYNWWKVSGHPYKLMAARSGCVPAKNRPIPLPMGYEWKDISYVIGGYKWKSRYLDTNGYVITQAITDQGVVDGMNQYNNLTGEWVDYHPGEVDKPYNCGACHTTGWIADDDADTDGDLSDNQGGLPGMWGTFAFPGVQCEACHGPANEMSIDRSKEACGQCHFRGEVNTIPAKGGFIRHHEQYNEQLASPHESLDCVDCHNPHMKGEFSIHTSCEDCHPQEADSYKDTEMGTFGVTCVDCHMAFASKSAAALGPFIGDIRTHLFTINTDKNFNMFTDDGAFVRLDADGQGSVTLDFACLSCHKNKDLDWAASYSWSFHNRPKHKLKRR